MKFAIVQPHYDLEYGHVEARFDEVMGYLDECDESMDFIVLPEYSDIEGNVRDKEEYEKYVERNTDKMLEKIKFTAKRCSAYIFANMSCKCEKGLRNTTFVIDKSGEVIGKYFKAHPAPSEINIKKLDVDYSYEFDKPYTIDIEGIRFAFLTCYDFYFYESFARIARENVDVIIGCSHQRTDTHETLETIGKFLCYNTNAYLVRASISLSEDSPICGCSMVVSPKGEMLLNMKNEVGIRTYEFDPKEKHYKPAGFGGKLASHYEYIEEGRRPWFYRPGGSAIVTTDSVMKYPRVCAHRGYSVVLPENSLPAFGAAVALGADEIEFDLWPTKDGEIVSLHDSTLDRVSTGSGKVYEHTYEELKKLDFGVKFDEKLKGLKIVRFEDILKKFACHTVMNIHIKPLSMTEKYPEEIMKKIVELIKKYDCEKYVYFMLEPDIHIKQFKDYAPHIPVCVGHLSDRPYEIVDRAIEFGAEKVQLFKPYFNKEMIDKAHANGIKCNVFWSDDENETREFLEMGIDTILTNNYGKIATVVKGE